MSKDRICILGIHYLDVTVTTKGGAEYKIPVQYKVSDPSGEWTDYWTPEKLERELRREQDY